MNLTEPPFIFQATNTNAPKVLEILETCTSWLHKQGKKHWDSIHNISTVQNDICTSTVFLMCNADSVPIGTITLSSVEPYYYKPTFQQVWYAPTDKALYFRKLAVHPNFHGQGAGIQLTRFAENFAIKENVQYIRLDINRVVAQLTEYYFNLGFLLRGEIEENIFMEKSLIGTNG